MDKLKESQYTLLYFSNDFEKYGITIQNECVKMINRDNTDVKILAKFINKYDKDIFNVFHNLDDKLCIKFKIKNNNRCFSKTTNKFIAFITYNDDLEHKATYKLTVYNIYPVGVYTNNYEYYNTYYSYFA